ncbi:aquaporin NIP2-1-like [Zingiber officinale]|uniref:Aquaporin NIP2-1 n=1 Tax=Zingiber officinale TaxID=94328 RepID=A0A8J5CAY7_ZINOF|nr:aquaporin NIP2-1-like [Zingiber officinale]KAG6471357.1 hypothetical protein ZIOFF_068798 [Zingiber officinale]
MASHSNEIHDIDVATAQNTTGQDTFYLPLPPRRRSFMDFFPPFLFQKVVSEVISTFLLVFVTCGSGALSKHNPSQVSQLGASVAGGLIVTVMIYAVGHISGAHMNPAVTLAFAVSRHFPWIQVPFYWGAQITGSTIASFILRELLHPITDLGTTTPSGNAGKALVAEILVTFNMMFVTLAVATDTRAVGELAGLAVGSAVCITSIFAGPISGGSMNPARTLGPAFASDIYRSVWVYLIGPPIGTVAGALVYNFIRLRGPTLSDPSQKGSQKSPSIKTRRMQRQDSSLPANDDGDAVASV